MQTWQLFPIVIVVGVGAYAYFMRGKLRQAAGELYGAGITRVRSEFAAERRPGETEPACVVAMMRTLFKAKVYFVGLTNQRLLICEPGQPMKGYDRGPGLSLAIQKKTFADVGNMTTTYSDGWEAKVELPNGGGSHTWRLYGAMEGHPEQGANLEAILRSAGAS